MTDRQRDKQNGKTIRLTLCIRDATQFTQFTVATQWNMMTRDTIY